MRAASVVLLLFTILSTSPRVAAGQTPYDPDRNQSVGAMAGAASGAGLMYQEILPSAFGYRGTLLLWKLGDSSFVDMGVSGLRVLSDEGGWRIYLVGGLAYWRHSHEEREPVRDDQGDEVGERVFDDVDDSWALGLGVGVETPVSERVSVNLEAAFTYWADSGDLLPLPQIGIGYRF